MRSKRRLARPSEIAAETLAAQAAGVDALCMTTMKHLSNSPAALTAALALWNSAVLVAAAALMIGV